MFRQTYLSAALPYRLPEEFSAILLPSLHYNDYLVTPPRIYGEELADSMITAMFTRRENTATANTTVSLLSWLNMVHWPGWEILLLRFDGATGAFVDRASVSFSAIQIAWISSIVQGFDGSVWASRGGLDLDIVELGDDLVTEGDAYSASHFGRSSCLLPVVDKQRDVVIMPTESANNRISVYTLSTGALLRTINVSDQVKYICPVDGTRVFVLGANNLLNLVDYSTGEILMTARCPTPDGNAPAAISWDVFYRRLLLFTPSANETDGAGTSKIHGYYPVPLPTQIMTPIPLAAPRKGRTVPVLTRLTGDVGEPVVGHVLFSDVGDASLASASGQADGQGYATVGMTGLDAGSADVTVSATV